MREYATSISVQKLCVKVLRIVNEHMDNDDAEESAKVAVAMSALTKMLAAMTVMTGVPAHVAYEALRAEMKAITDTNETIH
jgi:hypothetical protein